MSNARADERCIGWRRVTRPGACGFCLMLADRGAVYRESTAAFPAHSNCDCAAEPVFGRVEVRDGRQEWVSWAGDDIREASALQYSASKRNRSEDEKAALRTWVAYYEGR